MRKKIILPVIISTVVVISLAIYFLVSSVKPQIQGDDPLKIESGVGRDATIQEEASLRAFDGDYDGAIEQIDQGVSGGSLTEREGLRAKMLAAINGDRSKDAYNYAKDIIKFDKSSAAYTDVARLAAENKDQDAAKKYFKKAIDSLKSQGVERTMDEKYIKSEMRQYGVTFN